MSLYGGADLRGDGVSIGRPDVAAIRAANVSNDVADEVARWLRVAEDGDDSLYFAICSEGALVGQIFLHDLDEQTGESLVGYHLLQPRFRGRGIGTRALGLLQGYVRDRSTLRRLVIITSGDNVASRRIAEKCGFRYVGPPREDPTGVALIWDVPRDDVLLAPA